MPKFPISFVAMKGLVSKQTVVLRRWESEKPEFFVANESMKVKLPPEKASQKVRYLFTVIITYMKKLLDSD